MNHRSKVSSRYALSVACVILLAAACGGESRETQAVLGASGDADPESVVASPDADDPSEDSIRDEPLDEDPRSQASTTASTSTTTSSSTARSSSTTTSLSTTGTSSTSTTSTTTVTDTTTQITPPVTGGGAGSVLFHVLTETGQGVSASATIHGHTFSMPNGELHISDMTCGAVVTVAINDPNYEFASGGKTKTYNGCPPGVVLVTPIA